MNEGVMAFFSLFRTMLMVLVDSIFNLFLLDEEDEEIENPILLFNTVGLFIIIVFVLHLNDATLLMLFCCRNDKINEKIKIDFARINLQT